MTKIESWLLDYFAAHITLLMHQGLVTAKHDGPVSSVPVFIYSSLNWHRWM